MKKDRPTISAVNGLLSLVANHPKYINENNRACTCMNHSPIAAIDIHNSIFRGYCYAMYTTMKEECDAIANDDPGAPIYKNLTMNSYKEFLDVFEGKIFAEGKRISTALRIGKLQAENTFYYHLGDGKTSYTITRSQITKEKPKVIYSVDKQIIATQIDPDLENSTISDVHKIFKYINIENEHARLLLLTYITSLFNPEINKYILYFHGLKGSSKTTSFRIIRSLIDPCHLSSHVSKDANLVSMPWGNQSDTKLKGLTDYHYCLYFDNVNTISIQIQSELAKMALGQIDSERKLYTNNEQVVYTKKPCIGINGVNQIMTQDELIQRSLIIEIDRIKERKTDEEVWTSFHQDKPIILGAFFKLFQKTIEIIETQNIESAKLPRMADASRWMTATAIALGIDKDNFYSILNENVSAQDTESISFSPTADLIIKFMSGRTEWEGILTDLHKLIKEMIESKYKDEYKISSKPEDFPSTIQKFSMALKKVSENLSNVGYPVEKIEPRKKDGIHYKITNNSKASIEDSFLDEADNMLDF